MKREGGKHWERRNTAVLFKHDIVYLQTVR